MTRPTDASAVPSAPPEVDEKTRWAEALISRFLLIGVLSSLAIVAAGTVLSFLHHPPYAYSGGDLHRLITPGAAEFPRSVGAVAEGFIRFNGRAWVLVGLLLLIVTPVARVAVSVLIFLWQRDWAFLVITALVLMLLIASFFAGRAEGGP